MWPRSSAARAWWSTRAAPRVTNAATCCRWRKAASSTGTRCRNSAELIVGRIAGRTARDEITLYESHGMGIQDIYTGHYVFEAARAQGIGVKLPIGG